MLLRRRLLPPGLPLGLLLLQVEPERGLHAAALDEESAAGVLLLGEGPVRAIA